MFTFKYLTSALQILMRFQNCTNKQKRENDGRAKLRILIYIIEKMSQTTEQSATCLSNRFKRPARLFFFPLLRSKIKHIFQSFFYPLLKRKSETSAFKLRIYLTSILIYIRCSLFLNRTAIRSLITNAAAS